VNTKNFLSFWYP